ncbi:MAG: sensor histidine kinase [Bacillota bacterium]
MKKNSIVVKLFGITTVFFSAFLILALVSQSLFFEKFYVYKKIDKIQNQLEEFTVDYTEGNWDERQLNGKINEFMDNSSALMAILDDNGVVKHMNSFEMVIMTEKGKEITIPLSNIAYSEAFEELDLAVGKPVEVEGIYLDSDQRTLGLSSIVSGDKTWGAFKNQLVKGVAAAAAAKEIKVIGTKIPVEKIEVSADSSIVFESAGKAEVNEGIDVFKIKKDGMNLENFSVALQPAVVEIQSVEVTGKITALNIPRKADLMMPYKMNLFLSAIDQWFWLSKTRDMQSNESKLVRYQYRDPMNGTENVVLTRPFMKDGKVHETIFVMTSLQPVDEAIKVMKDYYAYVFAGALSIIILLALIFSKLIARPLIRMNQVAVKMANMDFSEQLEILSEDEIGSLSRSINLLSNNLSENIEKLRIANEQLKKDIEKERKLEVMRKEFISSVSHELKTPLSIIKSFAEGIKDDISQKKIDHYIDVILDESDKMNGLVMDMLELSKLESGGYKLDEEAFDIIDLMQQVQIKLSHETEHKGIHIITQTDEQEVMVYGDRRRIEQVLMNLLSNGIRHTYEEKNLYMIVRCQDDHITINIENEGDLIDEDKIDKIWDRFYRIEASRNRKLGGIGLGLSIVKNILELHSSQFGVRNTDRGVAFFFTLQKASDVVDTI